ncbi:MAG: DUF1648 domain-containing protein [Agathobacter sp.]|nr:DUF1648 domain-containing protein [Agathobacter sp.]
MRETENKKNYSIIIWGIMTIFCLLLAVISFANLPAEIPVQWNDGVATSFVDKIFIFAFPVACIIIRYLLRSFIWRWMKIYYIGNDFITECITNTLCFIALAVECFVIFSC